MVGKADVVGLMDAPLWVPAAPLVDNIQSLTEQTKSFLEFANANASLDPMCLAAHPNTDYWKCLFGAYRLPFISTPYFLVQSQYDRFVISFNVLGKYRPHANLNA